MLIIAFSEKTSKILPRILCRHFRHCAPIICAPHNLVMYQFIRHNTIVPIHITTRDINILAAHGWRFVYISNDAIVDSNIYKNVYSCVDLSKRALGIHNIFIQTPNALYKYLNRK